MALYNKLDKMLSFDFNLTSAYMLFDDLLCDYYENKEPRFNIDNETKEELMQLSLDYWLSYVFLDERVKRISVT